MVFCLVDSEDMTFFASTQITDFSSVVEFLCYKSRLLTVSNTTKKNCSQKALEPCVSLWLSHQIKLNKLCQTIRQVYQQSLF